MVDESVKRVIALRGSKNIKLKKLPSRMKTDFQLRSYQAIGTMHMFCMPEFFLLDGPGLGKTLQSITAYAYWLDKTPEMKLLVLTVKSAVFQWSDEFYKFTNNIETVPLSFSSDVGFENMQQKREAYIEKWLTDPTKQVLITNYATVLRDYEYLVARLKQHKTNLFLICDEANAFKNPESKIWQALWRLRPCVNRIVALSATPIKNRLLEFYAQLKIVRPSLFNSKENFEQLFVEKDTITFGKGRNRRKIERIKAYKNIPLFTKMIEPYCLGRKKSEISDELPAIINKKIVVEMVGSQAKIYNDAKKGLLQIEGGLKTKKIQKVAKLTYLQLISDSPILLNDPIESPSAKEEEFLRLIEDEYCDEKVVVYTRFRRGVLRLQEVLKKADIASLCIHGQLTSEERDKNKKLFWSSPDINVLIINNAASESINLQTASTFIFYNLPWDIGTYMQLQGRIHRIGSVHTTNMIVTLLNKNSVDEHTYATLEKKLSLVEQVQGVYTDIMKITEDLDITDDVWESLFGT